MNENLKTLRPEQAIARFRNYVNMMAVCGVLVLLLTALAKIQ